MSQKTLFTKSALAVAVAIISTQAWSAGFQLNEFSSSGLGRPIRVKAQSQMMRVTLAATRR
ncbi:long-chain fatty acid transport protein [Salmonella enterica subsp. salamae]|nr:long-chain fatty acid transport protein [Salmonella enterica subsp. salamae]